MHKIIWFSGLSDTGQNVLHMIKYYEDMAQRFGGVERAQQFSRFYPVPNMGHCSGGPATDQFDLLTPLVNWVENGTAPGPVSAKGVNFTPATYQVSFVSGPATRTRPLCPYPQQARFTGKVSVIGGVPIASNSADLADPTKYQCIAETVGFGRTARRWGRTARSGVTADATWPLRRTDADTKSAFGSGPTSGAALDWPRAPADFEPPYRPWHSRISW